LSFTIVPTHLDPSEATQIIASLERAAFFSDWREKKLAHV
jgi:hypothetical protein